MNVWERLRGSSAAERMSQLIATGEVAHAWLFAGPAGSGKLPAALAMAAALNCEVEPGRGCGTCSSCVRITRRRFPDVHHIVPEGPLIPVDVVREMVVAQAARSPFEGRMKVFILEEAERMNPAAQNAILKTLEEPVPDTTFVLISERDEELLDTVRSRCVLIRFEPVPEERVVEELEREGAPPETALLAARLSEGDPAKARALAFEDEAAERRQLWLSIPRRLVSPVDALDAGAEVIAHARAAVKAREVAQRDEVKELAEALGEARGAAQAKRALAKRHRRELRRVEEEVLGEALWSLASFYRDALAVRSGGGEAVTNLDRLEELERWAATDIPDGDLVTGIERLVAARSALGKNANVPLTVESALLELSRLAPAQERIGA